MKIVPEIVLRGLGSLAFLLIVTGCGQRPVPTQTNSAEELPEPAALEPGALEPVMFAAEIPADVAPADVIDPNGLRSNESPEPFVKPYRDWDLRETVTDALGRIGEPAVEPLIRMLRHPEAWRRTEAAVILARIGPEARQAVPSLIQALDDPDLEVRKAATRALGQIGKDAAEAVGPLLRVLEETGEP